MRINKRMQGFLRVAGVLTGVVCALAGCREKEKEYPTISLMFSSSVKQQTKQRISDLISEYTMEKIGCRVNLETAAGSSYHMEMKQKILEGNEADIFMVWELEDLNYVISENCALQLDEYLEQYPALKEETESWPWKDSVGAKTYSIPNNTDTEYYIGFICKKDMLGDIDIDEDRVYSFEELHDILAQVKKQYPDCVPVISHLGENSESIGEDACGDGIAVLVQNEQGAYEDEFSNFYASDMFYDWCTTMYQWNQEGLLDPFLTQNMETQSANMSYGNGFGFFARVRDYVIPNNEFLQNEELVAIRLGKNRVDNTLNALNWSVSRNTAYPELAVEFLNLMYTDPELYTICRYGEEGRDYVIKNGKYYMNETERDNYWTSGWVWPYKEKKKERAEDTIISPAYGFWFDPSDIQIEMDLCKVVEEKYRDSLLAGEVDPDLAIPVMVRELEEAGVDRIIEEKTKQFQKFLKEKNAVGQ